MTPYTVVYTYARGGRAAVFHVNAYSVEAAIRKVRAQASIGLSVIAVFVGHLADVSGEHKDFA